MAPLRNFFQTIYRYRYPLTYLGIAALVSSAFLYRLSALTPGPHSVEVSYLANIQNLELGNLLDYVVFLPHAVVSFLISQVAVTPLTIRLTSVIFAASMVPMLYVILRIWHTRRIATVGVIILLSSSWFIGLARLGTPDIMYAWGIMAAITAETLIFHHRKHDRWRHLVMINAALLVSLSLYSPYSIYIYILTAVIAHDYIRRLLKELGKSELYTLITLTAIGIAPLLAGFIVEPSNILVFLGLPESGIPSGVYAILLDMKDFFSNVFWRSTDTLITSVGSLPLLGLFGAAMASLGMYHYEQHRHNLRTHLVVGLFFGVFLLVALDYSPEKTAVALPLVYILIAMGVVTLLAQWYRIFPRNPFARTMGLALMTIFVITNVAYHNQRYFAAWARAPETKVAFSDDVILLEKTVSNLVDKKDYKTVEVIGESLIDARVSNWLEITLDEIELIDTEETEELADIVITGPGTDPLETHIDFSNYELDMTLDTTSLIAPKTFRIYIPISS